MADEKTDLRIRRTRKLIMDAFIDLSGKKEFKDITVKDITTEAMINRATFYYHFADKFELMEKALAEVLLVNLDREMVEGKELNEETLVSIFLAITNFQQSLSNRCHRGYEETIASIIRNQLEVIFYQMLSRGRTDGEDDESETAGVAAVMLSWGMYGASLDWSRSGDGGSPEEYIKHVLPYVVRGIG